MCKTDIAATRLSIKKIINVVKSEINGPSKTLHVSGRYSDAFVYILTGSCFYRFDDGRDFTVHQGDILYLAHEAVYDMRVQTERYRFIFCDFEFDSSQRGKSEVYTPRNMWDTAANLFHKLLTFHTDSSEASFAGSMSVLYDIYRVIFLTAESNGGQKSPEKAVAAAKKYMDLHYQDASLSVAQMAEQAGVSPVYFRKLFRQQYHISPSQYLISVRLEKAEKLMRYPFITLKECAGQCGFSSLQYFCRAFKKATGMTPGTFRKKK